MTRQFNFNFNININDTDNKQRELTSLSVSCSWDRRGVYATRAEMAGWREACFRFRLLLLSVAVGAPSPRGSFHNDLPPISDWVLVLQFHNSVTSNANAVCTRCHATYT